MINSKEILETIRMIQDECLDIRTTTMGISLLDCGDTDIDKSCQKIYDKICKKAEHLVSTGEQIEKEYGIPIINKRVSVTPIAIDSKAFAVFDDKTHVKSGIVCHHDRTLGKFQEFWQNFF